MSKATTKKSLRNKIKLIFEKGDGSAVQEQAQRD
jgi:hypothetical protein